MKRHPRLNGTIVQGNDGVPMGMTDDDKKKMWGNNPIEL